MHSTKEDQVAIKYSERRYFSLMDNDHYYYLVQNDSLLTCTLRNFTDTSSEMRLINGESQSLKKLPMWLLFRKAIIYLCVVWTVYMITYQDFIKPPITDQSWPWLRTSFVSNIQAQQAYDNGTNRNLNKSMNNKSFRLMIPATMEVSNKNSVKQQAALEARQDLRSTQGNVEQAIEFIIEVSQTNVSS
ncbi:unnamed protein product [Rotaria socialis]|uniref:Uncharacterized protein n=1 Tax=Rotaria socialis TaxID=392032 RepID=A0A817ZML1_9BILA|nr:unnamed protein product [Rotaria socialis]